MNDKESKNNLTSSMEDYLKEILILSTKNEKVRVKDIAKKMNYKKSSVNYAIKKLKEMNLLEHEKYSYIELTEAGRELGYQIYKKFNCLSDFFSQILGVESSTAYVIACKMEHYINKEANRRLSDFIFFYKDEKKLKREWIKRQGKYFLDKKGESNEKQI